MCVYIHQNFRLCVYADICGGLHANACFYFLSLANEAASYMVMLGSQHLFVVAFRPQRHPSQIESEFRHVRLVASVILIIFMF